MASLHDIVRFLDSELKTAAIADYSGAVNGLQLECDRPVSRIIAAVDASLPVIRKAAAGGSGLLVVHHGLFWQGAQPVVGAIYAKLKLAIDAGLAVYSSHLPLDVHPEWGNNILLARAIGLENSRPFLDQRGLQLGICGDWLGQRQDLLGRLSKILEGPVHLCPGGSTEIRTVGIVTGGAGSEVAKVAASGVDTFITGEGPHWSYSLAEELGMNLFYGGHYATETFGVRKVAAEMASRFGINWDFIDHPTGL